MVNKSDIYNIKMSKDEIISLLCIIGLFQQKHRENDMFNVNELYNKLMHRDMYNNPMFFKGEW